MWEEVSARVRAKECTSFIQCLSIFSSDVVRAPISCASLCDFTSQRSYAGAARPRAISQPTEVGYYEVGYNAPTLCKLD